MAFFQRVMSYLLNEVLVNGLANRCAGPGSSLRARVAAPGHPSCCRPARTLVAAGVGSLQRRGPRRAHPGRAAAAPPPPALSRSSPLSCGVPRSLLAAPPPARSRTFQKFAIRSSAMMEEAAKKSAAHKEQLGQVVGEKGGHFWRVFQDELTKGLKVGPGGVLVAAVQCCCGWSQAWPAPPGMVGAAAHAAVAGAHRLPPEPAPPPHPAPRRPQDINTKDK